MQDFTRVSDVMTKDVIHTISEEASAFDAAREMKNAKRGCLIIVKRGTPTGIVTERDLVQRVMAEGKSPSDVKVSEVMSCPLISVGSEALVGDAARIMCENNIRRLPVMDGPLLVGMITVTDFARYLGKKSIDDPMLAAMSRASEELWQTA